MILYKAIALTGLKVASFSQSFELKVAAQNKRSRGTYFF
jgi:hypothetical protein